MASVQLKMLILTMRPRFEYLGTVVLFGRIVATRTEIPGLPANPERQAYPDQDYSSSVNLPCCQGVHHGFEPTADGADGKPSGLGASDIDADFQVLARQ